MQRISYHGLVLLFLLQPFLIVAQPVTSEAAGYKQELERFIGQLNSITIDSVIVIPIARFARSEADNIYSFITSGPALTNAEKEKAMRSLVYFMEQLGENISHQVSDIYDVPGAMDSYKNILEALLYRKSYEGFMKPLAPRRTQMLATAFRRYKEYPVLDDIAVYKRMTSSPDLIFSFLESRPTYRFADSLIAFMAAHQPLKLIDYVDKGRPALRDYIRNSENIYVQQVVSFNGDRNASELLPFVIQLAENRLTEDEILWRRLDVVKYFQLIVDMIQGPGDSNDASFAFEAVSRNGLKEKSLYFYVNYINEQHGAADAVRFEPVKNLRPQDIYYILTSCGDELYTSSYLGLYKRLMGYFKNQNADSLFRIVRYNNFRTFMRMAANYNTLTDFLSKMPGDKSAGLLRRFISGIEVDSETGLEKAMDIADSFTGIDSSAAISNLVLTELQSNLNRCQSDHLYFGVRLYSILLQVFDLVKQKDSFNKLWSRLGNYEMLRREELQNKKREIIQMVLFYGDDDGNASFNNFLKLFTDAQKWSIEKNQLWVTIKSLTDVPISIYANMPLDNKEELDLKAQDALISYLQQESLEPVVLIHRGHSYHVGNTLRRLKPSVRLAILGSCGGYNNAISIANINPDAQIIVSKKTGAKSINDPIIEVINETLLSNNDLLWPEVWARLSARFSKDEATLNLFNEYIPPGKNVSLFVLKLFNFYNRPA